MFPVTRTSAGEMLQGGVVSSCSTDSGVPEPVSGWHNIARATLLSGAASSFSAAGAFSLNPPVSSLSPPP